MKINYAPEDLVWEATRRNENYKEYYRLKSAEGNVYTPCFHFPGNDKWKMDGQVLDPETDIDTIKIKMDNGVSHSEVHPYYDQFNNYQGPARKYKIPLITKEHVSIKRNNGSRYMVYTLPYDDGFNLRRFFVAIKNRLVISIDPLANNNDIFKAITMIKNAARKEMNEKLSGLSAKVSMAEINKHIEYLKVYDVLVSEIRKIHGETGLTIVDGAVIKPKSILYKYFADSKGNEYMFNANEKYISRAYKTSVKLIQAAPNIIFKASKS
jgi:hypothetical protein